MCCKRKHSLATWFRVGETMYHHPLNQRDPSVTALFYPDECPLIVWRKDLDNGCRWACFWVFDELGVIGCHDSARQPQDYPKNSGLILMSTMVCGSGNCKRPRGPWAIDVVAGRMRCDRWSQHNAQLGIDRVATRLAVAG